MEQDGEWRTRKITIMGVLRSFVGQLRPGSKIFLLMVGQDLTRVSLPAALLHPYSILEVLCIRQLSYVELLFAVNTETDPLERMVVLTSTFILF